MSDTELCYLSATDALARFRARTLSPVELMAAIVRRVEAVEPRINAYTVAYLERALEQARRAETRFAGKGPRPRRLEGIPVAVKDLHDVAGERTTLGSRLHAQRISRATEPTVERLLRAGAILVGRSTTSEFGAGAITHTPLWGVTRNPWNLATTPGGSSGGAAAAVAAGTTVLADGSDYGGSIRCPAAVCGVFGYKPPFGRNPSASPWNLDPYNHMGPITRTVADAALMQNVMAGPHPHDIVSLRQRVTLPVEDVPGDLRGWRVAFSLDLGYHAIEPDVARNARAALAVLTDLGADVEEVDIGWSSEVLAAFEVHSAAGFAAACGDLLPLGRYEMSAYARARIERGLAVRLSDLAHVRAVQARMYDRLGPMLARYHLLVCPTVATTRVPADQDPEAPVAIAGEARPFRTWYLCNPFNMLGPLPVASVPCGLADNAVPTGIQMVARSFDDARVFRAAAAFERARPWLADDSSRPRFAHS